MADLSKDTKLFLEEWARLCGGKLDCVGCEMDSLCEFCGIVPNCTGNFPADAAIKIIQRWHDDNQPNLDDSGRDLTMTGQEAFNELVDHFMGRNYYIIAPMPNIQANAVILEEVKRAYPKGSLRKIRDRMYSTRRMHDHEE